MLVLQDLLVQFSLRDLKVHWLHTKFQGPCFSEKEVLPIMLNPSLLWELTEGKKM
jgi:hypothetical protein